MNSHDEPDENSPEIKLDMALRSAFSGLDDLMILTCNSNTVDLVEKEKIAIGQILTRAQLVASFLMARQTPAGKLRVVSNG